MTELTVKLAKEYGMDDDELIQIKRGSLLHDMGNLGIPNQILHKPGPLTDDEWAIMKKHPKLAFDMIYPIEYLRPALDIPYCHHEKWDGTGYPRGLKDEDIPLPARLFAVVDVWDTLTSERPYRPPWKEEDVLKFINEQSGQHFDPNVVELFLKFIK